VCIRDLPPRNGFCLSFLLSSAWCFLSEWALPIYRVRVLYRLQRWDFFGRVDVTHELFPFPPSDQSVEKIPYTLE